MMGSFFIMRVVLALALLIGVAASKMQSVFHHVLPLVAPGILTGTIIGMAQALGETAPLLNFGCLIVCGGVMSMSTRVPWMCMWVVCERH